MSMFMRQFHTYQWRVDDWMKRTFSDNTRTNKQERACRLLEEALEAFQATGCRIDKAHELVEYVFHRPVGDPEKEAGGVALTLMAFATAHGFNLHAAAEDELARVDTPDMIAKIAAKRANRVVPGDYDG